MQANMATGASSINVDMHFTNRKLPSIHSESVLRSSLRENTYSYAEKKITMIHALIQLVLIL